MSSEDSRAPMEHSLELISDPDSVREIAKGMLHTVFFHRYFLTIEPRTHKCLDQALPYVMDAELETLIDHRVEKLLVDLDLQRPGTPSVGTGLGYGSGPASANTSATASPLPAQIAGLIGQYISQPSQGSGAKRGTIRVQFFEKQQRSGWMAREQEVCWEVWNIKISIAEPRNENDRAKLRKAMSRTLIAEVMKVATSVSRNKNHIPAMGADSTTNPFPYQITVNPKDSGWPARLRMY